MAAFSTRQLISRMRLLFCTGIFILCFAPNPADARTRTIDSTEALYSYGAYNNTRTVAGSFTFSVTANVYSVDALIKVEWPALEKWGRSVVAKRGYRYYSPKLVIFDRYLRLPVDSPCGEDKKVMPGENAYCPANSTIYLSYRFLDEALRTIGDNAAGEVIAHEFSHAVQDMGKWGWRELEPARSPGLRELQRLLVEYQSDCFSGVFMRYANTHGYLSPGDLDEADKILNRDDPTAPPYLRATWFWKGYKGGTIASCPIKQ
jgi:predicted metalloprotease